MLYFSFLIIILLINLLLLLIICSVITYILYQIRINIKKIMAHLSIQNYKFSFFNHIQ